MTLGFRSDFKDSLFSNYVSFKTLAIGLETRSLMKNLLIRTRLGFAKGNYAQMPKAAFEEAISPPLSTSVWGLLTGYDREDKVVTASALASVHP